MIAEVRSVACCQLPVCNRNLKYLECRTFGDHGENDLVAGSASGCLHTQTTEEARFGNEDLAAAEAEKKLKIPMLDRRETLS